MFCTKCGREINASQKFCDGCGAPNKGYKEPSELEKLVKDAIAGEDTAIEKIYEMTYRQGYSVAIQIVKNEQDALDMLQDAYISAFRNLNSLQNPEKLRSWFNQIVANRCKDWLKKKKPQLFTDITSEENDIDFEDTIENENMTFSPDQSVDYAETKRLMGEILDGLPEDQKLCVLMYYYEELSVSEIAETLGCSAGTVKSRLNYARKKIKSDVEALEKKGTKLYNIAPLPFILWMLRTNEGSISFPENFAGTITKGLAGSIAETASSHVAEEAVKSANAAKQTAGEVGSDITENLVDKSGKIASQVAGKTAVKAGAKHIATKIVAGIVAASLVGGGGYAAYNTMKSNSKAKSSVDSVEKSKEEVPKLTVTDEQQEQIAFATILFDFYQKENDGYDSRKNYELELSENKVPRDILQYVASGVACRSAERLGAEVQQDTEQESVSLAPEKSRDFLKNTFGYEVKDSSELEEILTADDTGSYKFKYEPNGSADTTYETIMYAQTGEDEYHFYTEVKPWNMEQNTYMTAGVMDVTAHKNKKSEIGGFVFDKIVFKAGETQNEGEFVKEAVYCMVRTEKETEDNPYNLVDVYEVNSLSQEVFVSYANFMMNYVKELGKGKIERHTEDGVYDGLEISQKEYKNVCENTLGRSEPYDITVGGNEIEDENIHFYGFWFDGYMYVKDIAVVQSMDGSITAKGTIEVYEGDVRAARNEGLEVEPEYTFKATGYVSDKSEIGIVIKKVEVTNYVESIENGNPEESIGTDVTNTLAANQIKDLETGARLYHESEESMNGQENSYTLNVRPDKIPVEVLKYVSSGIACAKANDGLDDVEFGEHFMSQECQELLQSTFEYSVDGWDQVAAIYPSGGNATSARMGVNDFLLQYDNPDNGQKAYILTKALQDEKGNYTFEVEVTSEEQTIGRLKISAHENGQSLIGGFVFDEIAYVAN